MSDKPWQVMTESDYDTYKNNKYQYEKSGDPDGRLHTQNEEIRKKYNIMADDYSYDDLQYQAAFGGNMYDKAAQDSLNEAKKYKKYNDPYADDLYNAYDELKNFNYNPEKDEAFKAYKDMYKRQGKAAQDKTYSQLTSLSGGRNNTWATAAAAQVGQAYAQKASDMIPQLAQKAYDKLLKEYDMLSGMSKEEERRNQQAFANAMEEYEANKGQADAFRDNAKEQITDTYVKEEALRDAENDEVSNRLKEEQINNAVLNGIKIQQEIEKNNIELQFLTEKELIELALGQLDIEEAKVVIEHRRAQTNKINSSI